ncbi:sulfatase family protein [Crateriforma spongiae]|uniref:sulfatase family protein n=1 Tax=Crateriforma spongiae TaxID=2724528 RepID=UPI0014461816|nr:sulfatase [Crateriforma spongiae]
MILRPKVCLSALVLLSLPTGLPWPSPTTTQAQDASSPNFVVFIADDAAWDDFGTYGNETIRTPNIDALAENGLRFDRAYLTCSSCSPSRCSILTSRYPHSTGAGELHLPLPADQVMVTTPLREAGYHTVAAGKWHLGNDAKSQFDRVLDTNGGPGNNGRWVEAVTDRPADQPFFAWLASSDPHRGYQPGAVDPPHDPADVRVPAIFPDTPAVREDIALYYDEISRFDQYIGKVVETLDRQGVLENTVVFVISDNGRPFPHCKTRVNVDGVRTPLVVHWPAGLKATGSTQSLVSVIDLVATMVDLAGVDRPPTFQGVSIRPILNDSDATVRRFAFAEHNWHDYRARERAVITQDHLMIRNDLPELPATPPADGVRSATYQEMQRLRDEGRLTGPPTDVFMVPRPRFALYDVAADPHCLDNLYDRPANESVQQSLRSALDAFADLTADNFDGNAEGLTPDGFDRDTGLRLPANQRSSGSKRKKPTAK